MKVIKIRDEFYEKVKKLATERGVTISEAVELVTNSNQRLPENGNQELNQVTEVTGGNQEYGNLVTIVTSQLWSIVEKALSCVLPDDATPEEIQKAETRWQGFLSELSEDEQKLAGFFRKIFYMFFKMYTQMKNEDKA